MKRRGQYVRLKSNETNKTIVVKVILSDSIQGYLGEIKSDNFLNDWDWYHPDTWEEV